MLGIGKGLFAHFDIDAVAVRIAEPEARAVDKLGLGAVLTYLTEQRLVVFGVAVEADPGQRLLFGGQNVRPGVPVGGGERQPGLVFGDAQAEAVIEIVCFGQRGDKQGEMIDRVNAT
ncbi:hypothetical protein ACRS85_05575 [Pluralibacter gergoviae]|uniref:hypothetical protein n=1 Tax=Pluralibacter gergoviae TaxID=61647 RepID=UPI003EE1E68E